VEVPVAPRTLADLRQLIGRPVGPTAWREVTQDAIDEFAHVTGDYQWIHTDPRRAADGPFGGTIAHGLYSLSLSPALSGELMSHAGFARSLNYGYDKIRFPAPVPAGCRLRMWMTVLGADEVADGSIHLRSRLSMEREGADKPVLVAESLARLFPVPDTDLARPDRASQPHDA
jgi:acyl dehydratase